MRRFKIKANESPYYPPGSPYYFWAFVFDGKDEMYSWYLDYVRKRVSIGTEDWITREKKLYSEDCNFAGMCLPFEWTKIEEDGTETRGHNIGNVIFHKERLGAGIVAHEMGHCAMWYERLIHNNKTAQFGRETGDKEERFLYLLHDFVKMFYQKAYKMKII